MKISTTLPQANTRYVDKDLNRCFLRKDLEKQYSIDDPDLAWEQLRAHQLNSILGPKGSANPKVDFIIDLHNTTANTGTRVSSYVLCIGLMDVFIAESALMHIFVCTGVALMMDARDDFSHEMAGYLQTLDDEVRVCNWATDADDHPLLPTVICCRRVFPFVFDECIGFSIHDHHAYNTSTENV